MTKRRTNQTILLILLVLSLAAQLVSCRDRDYSKLELDIHELASALAAGDFYYDSMHSLDDNITAMLYGLDESMTAQAYGGSGATPEAVFVAAAGSAGEAAGLLTKLESYNDRQIDIFAKYNTQYQPEAKNAVLAAYGRYVVYCVSNDSEAALEIISLYTEKQ